MIQELILTRGVPASGKTTWANKWIKDHPSYVNLNRDDLRAMLFGPNYKFTKERERNVTAAQTNAALAASDNGKSIIISDTNINPKTVEHWRDFADRQNLIFLIKDFYVDLDELLERNALRDGGVPPHVIYRMYYEYVPQVFPDWKVEPDDSLPSAIIVDVDGTLANHEGIRSPYDASKVHLDTPHQDIIGLVKILSEDHTLLVMTGRDNEAYNATYWWIRDHGLDPRSVFIRKEGDNRKDSIIKKELFDEHVRGKYNVKYVIDDRLQVIYMWRALGLRVLDVAGGEF